MYLKSISSPMYLRGKRLGLVRMDMTFRSTALAELCTSASRLTQRWGPAVGRAVAQRLLDLAAADTVALDQLPGARISTNGTGETYAFHTAVAGRPLFKEGFLEPD